MIASAAKIWVLIGFCFTLVTAPCLFAASQKGIIEGYVRDQAGASENSAHVFVETGEHEAVDPLLFPINTKHTVGAVGVGLPTLHHDNAHIAFTNKKGYFRLRVAPNKYIIKAFITVKGGRTLTYNDFVTVGSGQTIRRDIILK